MLRQIGDKKNANRNGSPSATVSTGARSAASRATEKIVHQMNTLDLEAEEKIQIEYPNKKDQMFFIVKIKCLSGYWKGASYNFSFDIPDGYPIEPPVVKCMTPIFHPNIDSSGNIANEISLWDINGMFTNNRFVSHVL